MTVNFSFPNRRAAPRRAARVPRRSLAEPRRQNAPLIELAKKSDRPPRTRTHGLLRTIRLTSALPRSTLKQRMPFSAARSPPENEKPHCFYTASSPRLTATVSIIDFTGFCSNRKVKIAFATRTAAPPRPRTHAPFAFQQRRKMNSRL